jgi:hypothetical protein
MITREEFGEISSIEDIIYYVEEYGLNEFYYEYNIIKDYEFSDYVEDDISNFMGSWTELRDLLNDMYVIWGCEYYCYNGSFSYDVENDLDVDGMKGYLLDLMIKYGLIAEEEDGEQDDEHVSISSQQDYIADVKDRALQEYLLAKAEDNSQDLHKLFG